MFKEIPEFPGYMISEIGVVIEKATDKIVLPTQNYRNILCVDIKNSVSKKIKASVDRLILHTYRPLKQKWKSIYAFAAYKDGNQNNLNLDNLLWSFETFKPIFMPGINCSENAYVNIPGFSQYKINQFGKLVTNNEKTCYFPTKIGGYPKVSLYRDDGRYVSIGVHRLVALALLEHPLNCDHLVVNHINGIRDDCRLSNLEWSTYSENSNHAYRTGLRTDKPCSISCMNISTRKTKVFFSMGECGRFFNVSAAAIYYHLVGRKRIIPYKKHYIKYENDLTEWPTKNIVYEKPDHEGFPVALKSITTQEVMIFESQSDAGKFLNCDSSSILLQIKYDIPIPYRGCLIRRYTKTITWPNYSTEDLYKFSIMNNIGKPIRVRNCNDGTITDYPSVGSFSKVIKDQNPHSIRKKIECGQPYKHYQISYL